MTSSSAAETNQETQKESHPSSPATRSNNNDDDDDNNNNSTNNENNKKKRSREFVSKHKEHQPQQDDNEDKDKDEQDKENERFLTLPCTIPTFDMSETNKFTSEDIFKAYDLYQVVHLRNVTNTTTQNETKVFKWQDIQTIYQTLNTNDQESWCIENDKNHNNTAKSLEPLEFLSSETATTTTTEQRRAYCSFLIQKDTNVYQTVLQQLPVKELPMVSDATNKTTTTTTTESISNTTTPLIYEPCLWIFFGRNESSPSTSTNIQGRPEHTDSITHDGTWHYQLSGTKQWHIRPTCKLLQHIIEKKKKKLLLQNEEEPPKKQKTMLWNENEDTTKFVIDCQQNDIIMINTRIWFHQTIIPPQQPCRDSSCIVPSVSYARDFRITTPDKNHPSKKQPTTTTNPEKDTTTTSTMTNLDGLYATKDIKKGVILFTEHDMPDCELYRSKTNPNCEVIELEDGTNAIITSKEIPFGEFFTIQESDDENEEDEDGEEFDEEEEYDEEEEEMEENDEGEDDDDDDDEE